MYKIIFNSSSQPDLTLTDEEYKREVESKADADGFTINGFFYPFRTVKDFKRSRPAPTIRPNIVPDVNFNKKAVKSKHALKQMIAGLEKYIKSARYKGGKLPKQMLDDWKVKFDSLK